MLLSYTGGQWSISNGWTVPHLWPLYQANSAPRKKAPSENQSPSKDPWPLFRRNLQFLRDLFVPSDGIVPSLHGAELWPLLPWRSHRRDPRSFVWDRLVRGARANEPRDYQEEHQGTISHKCFSHFWFSVRQFIFTVSWGQTHREYVVVFTAHLLSRQH